MSTPMKLLLVLNVATLVAVVVLGGFVVSRIDGLDAKVASIAAALPADGVASRADVQAVGDASSKTAQAVTDLSAQLTELTKDFASLSTQLAAISGTVGADAAGATPPPDSTLGKLAATLARLETTIAHVQQDVASVRGFVETICTAIGRCR